MIENTKRKEATKPHITLIYIVISLKYLCGFRNKTGRVRSLSFICHAGCNIKPSKHVKQKPPNQEKYPIQL